MVVSTYGTMAKPKAKEHYINNKDFLDALDSMDSLDSLDSLDS